MLVSEKHYLHVRKNSDTLVVCYAPVEVAVGIFPQYKSLEPVEADRLLINPNANNFYQDFIPDMEALLSEIAPKYRQVIHFGYSAGGYAALRFGIPLRNTAAIFALSPHLNLKRPYTRSWFPNRFSEHESDWDLIPLINSAECKHIYIFYGCFDLMDGVQIADSRSIINKNIHNFYYRAAHDLNAVRDPRRLIEDFLKYGEHRLLHSHLLAPPDCQQDAMNAYRIYLELMSKTHNYAGYDLTSRITSNCGTLAYIQARALQQLGKHRDALIKYSEAALIMRDNQIHLGELFFCMGNNYLDLNMDEMAYGAYRESMRWNSEHVNFHRVYAREAAKRGRAEDVRMVMRQYEAAHGRTPAYEAMREELEKAAPQAAA